MPDSGYFYAAGSFEVDMRNAATRFFDMQVLYSLLVLFQHCWVYTRNDGFNSDNDGFSPRRRMMPARPHRRSILATVRLLSS